MVPSLVNKGILLSKLPLHRQMNVASLIRAYKQYPRAWWWPAVHALLKATNSLDLVPNYLVTKWVREGRAFATHGGGTHECAALMGPAAVCGELIHGCTVHRLSPCPLRFRCDHVQGVTGVACAPKRGSE